VSLESEPESELDPESALGLGEAESALGEAEADPELSVEPEPESALEPEPLCSPLPPTGRWTWGPSAVAAAPGAP
jgi:hypothetical protein